MSIREKILLGVVCVSLAVWGGIIVVFSIGSQTGSDPEQIDARENLPIQGRIGIAATNYQNSKKPLHISPLVLPDEKLGAFLVAQRHTALAAHRNTLRLQVEEEVRRSGVRYLDEFEQILMSKSHFNQAAATLQLVGLIQHERAAQLLERYLTKLRESSVRRKAWLISGTLRALVGTGTHHGTRLVMDNAKNSPSELFTTIRSLGEVDPKHELTEEAVTLLCRLAEDQNEANRIRLCAVHAMLSIGHQSARAGLERIMKNEKDKTLRDEAARVFAGLQ